MKNYKFEDYFANIEIPETWATIEDFVKWYMEARMPVMMVPTDPNIIVSDNAVAYTVFRKPPYQIEVYVNFPNLTVASHAHPGMEIITMSLSSFGSFAPKLKNNKPHGGKGFVGPEGSVMLTFEKWPDGVEMTSAAANWVGETAGPKQEDIIRSKYPTAYIENGYADVTKNV